jgi:hypothetical protein
MREEKKRGRTLTIWTFLGEKDHFHYFLSFDKVAGARAPNFTGEMFHDEDEIDKYAGETIEKIDEICAAARKQPLTYIRLPPRDELTKMPTLVHFKPDGELFLANEDPLTDTVRLARTSIKGENHYFPTRYFCDAALRVRSRGVYFTIVRLEQTAFCYTLVRDVEVVSCEYMA